MNWEWYLGVLLVCMGACGLGLVIGLSPHGSLGGFGSAVVRMWDSTVQAVVWVWSNVRGLAIGLVLSGVVVLGWASVGPLANERVPVAPLPPSSPLNQQEGQYGPPGPKGEPGPPGDPGPVRTMSDAERLEQDIARLEALNEALAEYGEARPRLHEEGGR